MTRHPLRVAVLEAERELAAAGVPSPRVDAELLAAHVVGVPRGRLVMVPLVDEHVLGRYQELIARRAAREPLQHLLGTAVFGPVTLAVGPGVFTPRPETELLLEWGLKAIADVTSPLVVDLCTGSGARTGDRGVPAGRRRARRRGGRRGAVVGPAQCRGARRSRRCAGRAARRGMCAWPDPASRARDPRRPGVVQPAVCAGRHAGAAGGGLLRPAGRGLRRPRWPGDHPGGRDGGGGAAAARWPVESSTTTPTPTRFPTCCGGAGCWRTSRSTAISRVAPASRPPAARLPRCSESGFQCGECTQSRFRYTRGIACRA